MDADRWERINDLFLTAIALPADERRAFLATACGADEAAGHQLRRLVMAHECSPGFLDQPAVRDALRVMASSPGSSAAESVSIPFRAGSAFQGTGRFTVRRTLGAGGMGVVYEVHDAVRNELVALKTLRRARPADIYRLKQEFRSLADVAHPNLVCLYELIVEETDCFFTMELVDGVPLTDYLRRPATGYPPVRPASVRHVFRQLVDGVDALHRSGKLHRDIKPSNVLITPAGRVVILDFGLATDVAPEGPAPAEGLAGTLAYLAPERCAGTPPSESQDWYSVGVTMYEALTGRLPYGRVPDDAPGRERDWNPRPPLEIDSDVPSDLSEICLGLLERDPSRRLSGRDVTAMLGRSAATLPGRARSACDAERAFVGRRRYLDALESALHDVRRGEPRTVYLYGPSGIGKSSVVQRFLERVVGGRNVVVLRGRCYERESVPYKALDGVVDSLSQYLRTVPRAQAERLLPADAAALSRLFPVLLQAGSVPSARGDARDTTDPHTRRQRAFRALRELLTRMATGHPVIVFIDDLHWADADSAVLLEELLRPPDAPPVLTIACFRAEEVASKPFLQALLARQRLETGTSLPLEPMSGEEARAVLAAAITGRAVCEEQIAAVVRDAGGNPFLLRQMADHLVTHGTVSEETTVARMLDGRLRRLPRGGRAFLETLAICGRAVPAQVVHDAAGLVGDERPLVAQLRASHLLRASGSAERVELYHDRFRETLAAMVSREESRRLHGRLARALVARGSNDAEALYEHYREAGDTERAAGQAALAASKADAALAFDRAASYYRAALELAPDSGEQFRWREQLAAALSNAGRPAEAAEAYLTAAAGAPPPRAIELRRMAAEQLLIGGHIDRGQAVIRSVLPALRLRLARGPRAALASLLWHRLRLRLRGLAFVERAAEQLPPAELLRVDACWSIATGFVMVDYLLGAGFHARHTRLALQSGEPYRIARGLAAEAFYLGAAGGPRRHLALAAVARAEAMAARVGHPHAMALCALVKGASAFLAGDWPAAQADSERALEILAARNVTTTWELNCAHVFRVSALLLRGRLREGSRLLPELLAAAKGKGNLYFETELRTRMNLVWLVADRPDEGLQEADEAMRHWSQTGFHRQHYCHLLARVQTFLYGGRAHQAWQAITSGWPPLERSHLQRIQFQRIESWWLRGRCALAMAEAREGGERFLDLARHDARRIAREGMPWSDPLASLLLAGVASLEGRPQTARARLDEAVTGFERAHMALYVAVAKRRLGDLTAGDRGRELRLQADEWMAAQGVVKPACIARLIAPGFSEA